VALISWQPVSQNLLGNPVTPSYYRIELSFLPGFADFEVFDTTPVPHYLIPLSELADKAFIRIVAVKLD